MKPPIGVFSFITSTNPAKSEIRLFGREEKVETADCQFDRLKTTTLAKVPPFLDRRHWPWLLSRSAAETDIRKKLNCRQMICLMSLVNIWKYQEERVYMTIGELSSIWLLRRTSPPDQYRDMKCRILSSRLSNCSSCLTLVGLTFQIWDSCQLHIINEVAYRHRLRSRRDHDMLS
ncbi:hypothetical protein M378DRAFT_173465 [Amanita muscaria Koide BX008]|uniref:Uncharacterized protein n=1 Tax=Amanita muscaria (strain Koide BX008) TaxID=946122 RepID=A0A0C2WG90_AMAMK|nr:hypothetical protein M378DRAFT_173465 [Amanita muscaria Koide BX008]